MRLEPEGAVSLLLLLLPASGNMLLWSLPLPLAQMEALAMFSDGLNNSRLVLLLHSLTMARAFGGSEKQQRRGLHLCSTRAELREQQNGHFLCQESEVMVFSKTESFLF